MHIKSKYWRKSGLITLILLTMYFKGYSQSIITDRPDQTEAAVNIPKGSFQIETGVLITNQKDFKQTFFPTTVFKYGLSNTFELRLVHEYASIKKGVGQDEVVKSGMGDIQIGTRVFIYESNSTNVAFITHLLIPTGNDFISSGDYGTINKLSVAHEISDVFEIGYNVGYDYIKQGSYTYSLALGFGLTEKIGCYLEPFGSFTELDNVDSNFDMGFTYLLKNNLQLDFSFGFETDFDSNYTAFGVSWNIPK